jgi:hypothetical protein
MSRHEFQFPLWTIFAVTACVAVVFAAVRLLPDESRHVVGLAIVIGLADCLFAIVFTLASFAITSKAFDYADRVANSFSRKGKNDIAIPPKPAPPQSISVNRASPRD